MKVGPISLFRQPIFWFAGPIIRAVDQWKTLECDHCKEEML